MSTQKVKYGEIKEKGMFKHPNGMWMTKLSRYHAQSNENGQVYLLGEEWEVEVE